jgi:hypothetical protein
MGRVRRNLIAILVTAACGLLVACHHSGGAALVRRHVAPVAGGGGGADPGVADLVSAVSLSGSGDGAVGLKFQLRQRPVAGQPVAILLRMVANQPLEHLEAHFRTEEGLEIPQGGDFDPEGHMDAGSAVEHNLTVQAAHEGVYTVIGPDTSAANATAAKPH